MFYTTIFDSRAVSRPNAIRLCHMHHDDLPNINILCILSLGNCTSYVRACVKHCVAYAGNE